MFTLSLGKGIRIVMIGVLCKDNEKDTVREFFELFKVPWQHYDDSRTYDICISTRNETKEINVKLLIIFSSRTNSFDEKLDTRPKCLGNNQVITVDDFAFPIYGELLTFQRNRTPLLKTRDTGQPVAIEIPNGESKVVRVGYDLFQELSLLLSDKHDEKYAIQF